MAKRKKNSKFIRHLIIVLLIFGYYYIKDNQESYSKQDNPPIEKKEPIQQVTTDLSIHYIDVGQADSILITNNNHSMLIDAGNNADGPLLVKYLKEQNKDIYCIGVEPLESNVLNNGIHHPHLIEGIGAGFIPQNLNEKIYDEVVTVSDENAFDYAKLVCKTEGLSVGISAGAALSAAVSLAKESDAEGKNIVVIFPDTASRYLSTELF